MDWLAMQPAERLILLLLLLHEIRLKTSSKFDYFVGKRDDRTPLAYVTTSDQQHILNCCTLDNVTYRIRPYITDIQP